MSHINLLTLEILLDVNEQIKIRASKDHRIEYSGSEDANHRTALAAIEMFLEDNGLNLDYTPVEAFDFRKELYNCRLMVYKTYEEMSTKVLKEDDNQAGNSVFALCLKFIKAHVR